MRDYFIVGLIQFLALLHHRFIRIHPFDDGNGRVVRLLVNYVLLNASQPPMVIKTKERKRYLETLAMADAGDLEPLQEFFKEALAWSLRLGIKGATSLIGLESEDENEG